MIRSLAILSAGLAVAAGPATAAQDPNLVKAQAVVAGRCAKGTSPHDSTMWMSGWTFNALLGDCGGGDGHDQHVWFFVGGSLVGTDAPRSSAEIIGLWRNDRTMAFLYVLYRPRDALCCATGGGAVVRFRLDGRRVVALDPLPPRAASSARPGRYP
ncbi:MAG TPA: LppP/LprE family lipoprotein [Gaiellaceae bacterium]|nr:LppP/LprE family lipoprotein [Gaiellaceae bacterium]